ncbi:probable G-protein coupled receptor 34 [Ailuropoda melanoleuca]|uniref:Probable G-protein coupled receptor 34 n=2 Tax=Ailuropoda melanoleuca TaxID=9646 RepID=G1MMN0_AILME|nr:probable G-protein coupled receptor 34 [Ailuropoda melanoleuca]XP_011228886.1 probable G-protein coupled receptor 34 [Ailuropoda melanoleuca]XP_019660184.1 probable G-protein coupled receptor 34 [Ailuropoda melanoleuca]XP_019660188.1 probable G-protein coupled receptor 34 [Ailuropoda melanoleuca]XP_034504645.1 probable G-protein coupled receptor 34 [Ailuropoda melanoleuca]
MRSHMVTMMTTSARSWPSTSQKVSPMTNHSTQLLNSTGEADNVTCSMDEKLLSSVLIISYSVIFIVGLVGNIIALYVFLGIHRKRNSIQIYLLNVAIADLLLIFCLPFRIMYHINGNQWTLGVILCKVVGTLFYMNMYISIILLGFISLDRYIKINRSIQQRRAVTTKQSIYVCCTVWTVAVAGFLTMITLTLKKRDHNSTVCFHYREKHNAKGEAIFNYVLVVMFWLIFLLIILSYIKIGKNLLRISKRRSKFPNSGKYAKTARNSFIVLIIFTVCFVPYHAFRFVYISSQLNRPSCYWKDIIHKTNEIMLVFSSFNSCLDPVMYFLMSSNIRKIMCQLLSRRFQGEASRSESTSEFKPGYSLHDTSAAAKIQSIS